MDLDYAIYYDELKHSNDNAYDDDYDYDAGATNWDKYTILSFVGAIGFVFNAAWDMYWCYGRERERQEKIDKGEESDDKEENEACRADEKRSFSASFSFGIAAQLIWVSPSIFRIILRYYCPSLRLISTSCPRYSVSDQMTWGRK